MTKTTSNMKIAQLKQHGRDETLTIKELMDFLGTSHPNRQSYHNAIKRGKLKRYGLPEEEVRINVGELLDLIDQGRFGQRRRSKANQPSNAAESTQEPPQAEPENLQEIAQGAPDEHDAADLLPLAEPLADPSSETAAASIRSYANQAARHGESALHSVRMAMECAWNCGRLLHDTKAALDHGRFIPWLEKHVVPSGPSVRSCNRYLQLFHKWPDLQSLLASGLTLTDACNVSGILSKEDSTAADSPEEAGDDGDVMLKAKRGSNRDSSWALGRLNKVHKAFAQICEQPLAFDEQETIQIKLVLGEVMMLAKRLGDQIADANPNPQEDAA